MGEELEQSSPCEPVVGIHSEDAAAFCQWLTLFERETGLIDEHERYRLPSAKEWDQALGPLASLDQRGGGIPDSIRFDENLSQGQDGFRTTAPVGQYPSNPFGIFDLAGNVAEWCFDVGGERGNYAIVRGASWKRDRCGTLIAKLAYPVTNMRSDDIGFRVVFEKSSD